MSEWTKLPALTEPEAGLQSGCTICGPTPVVLPLTAVCAVGFGDCVVTRDGEGVWQESPNDEEWLQLQHFEDMAAADPDHDWRIDFNKPLSQEVYQRQASGQWVLVEKGQGFA